MASPGVAVTMASASGVLSLAQGFSATMALLRVLLEYGEEPARLGAEDVGDPRAVLGHALGSHRGSRGRN